MKDWVKIVTVLIVLIVGSYFLITKPLLEQIGSDFREVAKNDSTIKSNNDSIKALTIKFTILKQERDSLLFKYDSLSKTKKDAHIKKINSYRTLTLDSNVTILSRTLSEKNITW